MVLRLVFCFLVIACSGIVDSAHCQQVELCIVNCRTTLFPSLWLPEEGTNFPNSDENSETAVSEERHGRPAGTHPRLAISRAMIDAFALRVCRGMCHSVYPTQAPEQGDTESPESTSNNPGEESSGEDGGGAERRRRILSADKSAAAGRHPHSRTKTRGTH